MTKSLESKPTRPKRPVRLGRSPATGTYILEPVGTRTTVPREKITEAVEKVIASRGG